MVKKLYIIIFVVILFLVTLNSYQNTNKRNQYEYYYTINQKIENFEFYNAYVEDYVIKLYDKTNTQIFEIPFKDYNKNINIICISKKNNNIYFTLSGSVDDEDGIMFINDETNSILDGVNSIKRVDGKAYRYSTSGGDM